MTTKMAFDDWIKKRGFSGFYLAESWPSVLSQKFHEYRHRNGLPTCDEREAFFAAEAAIMTARYCAW